MHDKNIIQESIDGFDALVQDSDGRTVIIRRIGRLQGAFQFGDNGIKAFFLFRFKQ